MTALFIHLAPASSLSRGIHFAVTKFLAWYGMVGQSRVKIANLSLLKILHFTQSLKKTIEASKVCILVKNSKINENLTRCPKNTAFELRRLVVTQKFQLFIAL